MNKLVKPLLVLSIILNIALRFRLVEIFSQYPIQAMNPYSDESGYFNLGLHLWEWLLHGHAARLPLYPAFLSLFVQNGLPEAVIYIVQHLLFMGSALAICCALFAKWNWRLTAFNLIIYYGPFVTSPNGALSETFTASMMLLALSVFIRGEKSIWGRLSGAFLFGLLSLSRPNFLPLFPLILTALFITKQLPLKSLILMLLIFTLPVAGWMCRNRAIQGSWLYNSSSGPVIYMASRMVPPYCPDEMGYFNDVFGTNRPQNLLISLGEVMKNSYGQDNMHIYMPVKSNNPSMMNEVLGNRNYKKLALENYTYYILNRPDLLLYKVSNWLTGYMTTGMATFEYSCYRNGSYLHSRLIGILYVLAVFYDVLFFPAGLVALILSGFVIVRFPNRLSDYRLTVLLYALLCFSLISPIPTFVGNRFTIIQMLAIIVSCFYLIPACVAPWIRRENEHSAG